MGFRAGYITFLYCLSRYPVQSEKTVRAYLAIRSVTDFTVLNNWSQLLLFLI